MLSLSCRQAFITLQQADFLRFVVEICVFQPVTFRNFLPIFVFFWLCMALGVLEYLSFLRQEQISLTLLLVLNDTKIKIERCTKY